MSKDQRLLPFAILVLLALIWGSSFILMKKGLEAFDPIQLAMARLSIAAIVFLPFLISYLRNVPRKKLVILFLSGLFGNGLPAYLFAKAETVIDSAVAGILNVLSPLAILIIGAVFFGAKFSRGKISGVLLGLVGAVILILARAGDVDFIENAQYSLLVVVATLCYSISSNLIAYKLKELSPVMITTFSLSMLGFPSMIYLFAATDFMSVMQTHPDAWSSLGFIAVLGALGTAVAVVIFTKLLQLTDAVFASSVTYLIPIVALAWGLYRHEQIVPLQIAGMVVILSGVYLVNRK
ncbi:MAG: DMT family transporter [Bacteroidia bacterium]|nr:DMT family transporter [Bacteroidia bacterium]